MNYLFLDFDGVLNSTDWFVAVYPDIEKGRIKVNRDLCGQYVWHLEKLCEIAQPQIIVSSTWRKLYNLDQLQSILLRHGFMHTHLMAGVTDYLGCDRGLEIQKWMTDNGGVSPEQIVILDDSTDMAHLMPRLVQTNNQHGLTRQKAQEVLCKLKIKEEISWAS